MPTTTRVFLLLFLTLAVAFVISGGRVPSPPLLSVGTSPRTTQPKPEAPDEAVRRILTGLQQDRLEVLWEALPASFQRDLNSLARDYVERVPPEVWNESFKVIRAASQLVQVAGHQTARDWSEVTELSDNYRTFTRAVADGLSAILDAVAASDLANPHAARTMSVGTYVRWAGANVLRPLRRIAEEVPADADMAGVLRPLNDLSKIVVQTKQWTGDVATVSFQLPGEDQPSLEQEFVRVEGKWLPKVIADQWPAWLLSGRTAVDKMSWSPLQRDETVRELVRLEQTLLALTATMEISGIADFLGSQTPFGPSLHNSFVLLGYLIGGPPNVEADFHKQTNISFSPKDTTILVMCYAPTELRWDNDTIDEELARQVAARLQENNLRIIEPDRVQDWLHTHKDWQKVSEIGAEFEVDYIVHIDLKDYSLFEEHSSDLYRGRADALITVVKMDDHKKDGNVIYSRELDSRYPAKLPVSVYDERYANFKACYQSHLSRRIGALFCESLLDDDDGEGMGK